MPETKEPSILLKEVQQAIHKLGNNKSPGTDGIPAELLKTSGEAGHNALWGLCNKIWDTGEWPEDWVSSVFVTIHKKGDLTNCDNYRTIALISHASKILLNIILNRLQNILDQEIAEEQAGFRKGKGTRDQIFNLQLVIQKKMATNTPVYIAFIDYKKAFDSVSHQKMISTLLDMGFPKHIVALIQTLYSSQRAAVQVEGENTLWFSVKRGVRQGCIISPALFNIYSELIMRKAIDNYEGGTSIGGRTISNLRYADDVALLAESEAELKTLLKSVSNESQQYDLYMNVKKTKIMVCSNQSIQVNMHHNGEPVEQVDTFCYLGASFSSTNDSSKEIRRRLAIARNNFIDAQNLFKDRSLSLQIKVRLIHALVFPIAIYGCEAWTLKKADTKRISAFELWCYRRTLRVTWKDKRTNDSVLTQIAPKARLMVTVRKLKLQYFGHVARGSAGDLAKVILEGKAEGTRGRGRPKTTWETNIKSWTGLSLHKATQAAQTRSSWRRLSSLAATNPQDEDGT